MFGHIASSTSSVGAFTDAPCSIDHPALLLPVRLETRRLKNELCIRVYPDQPFINAHRHELTPEEYAAATEPTDAAPIPLVAALTSGEIATARGQWRELARRFGPNRAAWILETLLRDTNPATSNDEKAFVPRLFLLPDRFVFLVYKGDTVAYRKVGKDIASDLMLLPAPSAAADDDTPPADGLFDAQSRWVTDFDAAVAAGLGIRIPLHSDDAADPKLRLSGIVVVGLRTPPESDAQDGPPFAQLVNVHRHTEGFEILPWGTPTNNTLAEVSGHSESEEEPLTSFDYEVVSPIAGLSDERLWMTAYAQLSHAMGLPFDAVPGFSEEPPELRTTHPPLAHIKGADSTGGAPSPPMIRVLWPATGDYFLSTMLGYEKLVGVRSMLMQHVTRWLRPQGPLPSIRVGNQPYGILPATRTTAASDPWAWKQDERDHPRDRDSAARAAFDSALHEALTPLLRLWLDRAGSSASVPRAGTGGDPDEEVLQLLGMSPHSLDYRVRPIVDQTLIGILLLMFGDLYFGSQSSFAGLADAGNARATWVEEKEKISNATLDVLQKMGATNRRGCLLWRAFAWGNGAPLNMPLVRDAEKGPEDYLQYLRTSKATASPAYSNTLLYDLIRRSYQLAANSQVLTDALTDAVSLLGESTIEFFGRAISATTVEALARQSPKPDPFPDDATFDEIAQASPFTNLIDFDQRLTGIPSELRLNLLNKLKAALDARLETSLQGIIDALTYRLDTWYTSLATQRLVAMRERNPGTTHWGAYGYLEDLELPPPPTEAATAAGGGFIHGPSVAHASAAAILRSAFESHRHDDDGNAYALNLTSARVERALALVEGVQQGQDLTALLGYQFERRLHDEGIDRVIADFRAAFPITEPDEEEGTEASAETIAARHVCDGRRLAAAYVENDPGIERVLQSAELGAEDRASVRALLGELADTNDAVGDVLLFEGVYQAVQGNVERCGAAFDACAGAGKPPEIESMSTPGGGESLRHRVCLFLPSARPSVSTVAGPRETAEPRLNAWLGAIFGTFSEISCSAYITPPDEGESLLGLITLDKLEPPISPLDFLYMCSSVPTGNGDTEIERLLRRYARPVGVAPDARIRLALDEAAGRSVADAMELGRNLLEMLGSATPVTPASLMHPDEAPPPAAFYNDGEIGDFVGRPSTLGRTEAASALLDQQKALLQDSASVLAALDVCAKFGISEAVVDREDDESHLLRAVHVLPIVEKRVLAATPYIAAARQALNDGKPDQAVDAARNGLKELFGASFITLPAIDVQALDPERVIAFTGDAGQSGVPSEARVWLWLQQVAETHPRVRRFETAMMAVHAWAGEANAGKLTFGQRAPGARYSSSQYGWQALSDTELGALGWTTGRARGAQSVVAMVPAPGDPSESSLNSGELVGLVVDEWTERLAAPRVTTGISFEYNQPSSQAPQCFLLATPGNFDTKVWTPEHLAEIVRDTMNLAKARLVDLDALPAVGGIFPALMFPISATPPFLFPGNAIPFGPTTNRLPSDKVEAQAHPTANAV